MDGLVDDGAMFAEVDGDVLDDDNVMYDEDNGHGEEGGVEEWESVWSAPPPPPSHTQETQQPHIHEAHNLSGAGPAADTSRPQAPAPTATGSVGQRMLVGIKAGMETVDKDMVNSVIAQASEGSRFWRNEVCL
jgi:hypothetical protein